MLIEKKKKKIYGKINGEMFEVEAKQLFISCSTFLNCS